jgi:hypothetical protein
METRRAVFFPSLPKCGKNLVYSFYFALGMKRWTWGGAPSILHRAYFARSSKLQNYAFPEAGPVSDEERAATLGSVFDQLGAMPDDTIANHHFLPEPELIEFIAARGIPTVFIRRDPRDVLVSMLNFARKRRLPPHVAAMLEPLSDQDALLFLLEGGEHLVPFAHYFDAYYDWLSAPGVTQVRFEDLVGHRGGGDEERQREACAKLGALAGFTTGDKRVERASRAVFNVEAGTFFKGQIGAWRDAFTQRVDRAFDRHAGALMERWGYGAAG